MVQFLLPYRPWFLNYDSSWCRAIKLLGRNPVKCDIRHSLKRRSNKTTIQDLSTNVCVVSEYLRCTVYCELKQRQINTKHDINKNICITITYIHYILQYFLCLTILWTPAVIGLKSICETLQVSWRENKR